MAETKERPVLNLEEEIINNISHSAAWPLEVHGTLATMPGTIERVIEALRPLNFAKGQLSVLEENEELVPDSKTKIEKLKKFISETEDKLKKQYHVEEIKGYMHRYLENRK